MRLPQEVRVSQKFHDHTYLTFVQYSNYSSISTTGYQEYFASLNTSCASEPSITNAAGVLEFTPDRNTPDLIYYQSVTQMNLGWEIHVIDEDAPSIVSVNCDHFGSAPVQLTSELTFHGIVDPIQNTITMELIYDGLAWISIAFTKDGRPDMVGAEAVIGLPATSATSTTYFSSMDDDYDGNSTVGDMPWRVTSHNPAKYHMFSNTVPGVVPMPSEQQTLINATIGQTQTMTIMRFTKRLFEPGEHAIFSDRPNLLLFAHGSNNQINSFHSSFGAFELLPNQCAVYIKGELQNEHALNQQHGGGDVDVANMNHALWIGHGVCAVLAWGILVPLAIGASMIRKVLVKVFGLSHDAWFQIHRALNLTAGMLTMLAFWLAVRAINNGTVPGADPCHFGCGVTHRRIGLVIFMLTIIQVNNGIWRPRHSSSADNNEMHDLTLGGSRSRSRSNRPQQPPILPRRLHVSRHSDDGDEETLRRITDCVRLIAETPTQNTSNGTDENEQDPCAEGGPEPERSVWQISHRLYGFVLLALAWWQVHDGLGLFTDRFNDDHNLERHFWIIVSSIAGSIAVIAIFAQNWC